MAADVRGEGKGKERERREGRRERGVEERVIIAHKHIRIENSQGVYKPLVNCHMGEILAFLKNKFLMVTH